MNKCKYCNENTSLESNFCPNCGLKIDKGEITRTENISEIDSCDDNVDIAIRNKKNKDKIKVGAILISVLLLIITIVVQQYFNNTIALIDENMETIMNKNGHTNIGYVVKYPYSLLELNTFFVQIDDYSFLEYSYAKNMEIEKEINNMKLPYAKVKSDIVYYSSPINSEGTSNIFKYDDAEYKAVAKHIIQDMLKSPSSAKFGDIDLLYIDNNVYASGYVDSDNSFGANLRTKFVVSFISGDIDNYDVVTE